MEKYLLKVAAENLRYARCFDKAAEFRVNPETGLKIIKGFGLAAAVAGAPLNLMDGVSPKSLAAAIETIGDNGEAAQIAAQMEDERRKRRRGLFSSKPSGEPGP
jgi:hypothetical protein